MEAGSDLMTFEVDEIIGECDLETQVAFHEQIKDGEANGKSTEENVASLLEAMDAGGDKNEGNLKQTLQKKSGVYKKCLKSRRRRNEKCRDS